MQNLPYFLFLVVKENNIVMCLVQPYIPSLLKVIPKDMDWIVMIIFTGIECLLDYITICYVWNNFRVGKFQISSMN
jgi:hypothetical protein